MAKNLVITIDGPAGAGKSTVSQALAVRLSYLYLDTGAIYRAIAYKVMQSGILPDDDHQLSGLIANTDISLKKESHRLSIYLDGEDITEKIRTEGISMLASTLSARPCVREALLQVQRKAGAKGGIVAEGRDMGTVVFPDADYKFYLDADVAERARRRYEEIAAKSGGGDYHRVEEDLIIRDKQDRERAIAPLKPAENAVLIDSTNMSIQEVLDRMVSLIGFQNIQAREK